MHDLWLVDAFSTVPLKGNGCGVIFDADDLGTADMHAIAREMNQSETIFFLEPTDPDADYHIRIFTPMSELPFAGHPTLSAAHAILERKPEWHAKTALTQQCKAGLIPLNITQTDHGQKIMMTQKTPVFKEVPHHEDLLAAALNISDPQSAFPTPALEVSTGLPWIICHVTPDVITNNLNISALFDLGHAYDGKGIAVYAKVTTADTDIKVRAFHPTDGVIEDPVTGSAQGCVAAALWHSGYFKDRSDTRYTASQGAEVGREGRVYADVLNANSATPAIQIGGYAITSIKGQLFTKSS